MSVRLGAAAPAKPTHHSRRSTPQCRARGKDDDARLPKKKLRRPRRPRPNMLTAHLQMSVAAHAMMMVVMMVMMVMMMMAVQTRECKAPRPKSRPRIRGTAPTREMMMVEVMGVKGEMNTQQSRGCKAPRLESGHRPRVCAPAPQKRLAGMRRRPQKQAKPLGAPRRCPERTRPHHPRRRRGTPPCGACPRTSRGLGSRRQVRR